MDFLKDLKIKHHEIEKILSSSIKEIADIKFALDESSIVAITDQTGKITYINDKFCEISKYSRKELLGQDHRIINSGYHPKEFMKNLWQTITRGEVWKGEIKNKAKDGSYYWVNTTIVPFLNEKKKPYQYVAIRHDITNQKYAEEALKALPQQIIQAQEAERERISRDIHDDLGQSLVALKMHLHALIGGLHLDKKESQNILHYMDTTIEKTRGIAYGLRPSMFEILGLATALSNLVDDYRKSKKLSIRLSHKCLEEVELKADEINLYRIIQEALNNIVKHAQAEKVSISMKLKKGRLLIKIEDDGKGCDARKFSDQNLRSSQSLGFSTMKERARLLGGEFHIECKPQQGVKINMDLPVKVKKVK